MNWRTSCTSNKHLEKRAPLALLQCSAMTAQWLLPGLSRAASRPVVLCQTHFMSSYQQYFNHRVPCMPGCVTLFCSLPALLVHLGMQTGLIMNGGAVWWFLVLLFVLFLPSFLARWCLDKGKIILCHGTDGECKKRTSYDTRSSLKHTLWSQYVYIKTQSLKKQNKKPQNQDIVELCARGTLSHHHLRPWLRSNLPPLFSCRYRTKRWNSAGEVIVKESGDQIWWLPRWPIHSVYVMKPLGIMLSYLAVLQVD